ncbi:MAG: catalase family protein [Planctomycetaceae bacterium]|nr:catalase family protein [Planctomycetaceae bacterium]
MTISSPLFYSDDVECIPVEEEEDIQRVLVLIRQALRQSQESSGQFQRDVHVKAHGCARGEFRVIEHLPPELSQGLFAEPRTYPAFVRFSNASPVPLPDVLPDGRGLAIQVHDLSGEFLPNAGASASTQDFIMVNHSAFIASNVKDYLRLQAARLETKSHPITGPIAAVTNHTWNPLEWKWSEMGHAAQVALQLPKHPADYTYYSMAPIRFGKYIAKYRVTPDPRNQTASLGQTLISAASERDALRELLEKTLESRELVFEFQVQLCTDKQTMPIEDATVEWSEQESPYQTVAVLTLPAQDIRALRDEGERRCFSVWNALSQHRPLGGINRVRRLAYAASAAWRAPTT